MTIMMYYNFLVMFSAVAVRGAIVKRAACSHPTALSQADIQAALKAHNNFRAHAGNDDAANEIKLEWDDNLAKRSQDWAELCLWDHALTNQCDEKTSVGQNLATTSAQEYNITDMVKWWNDEKQFYNYNTGACSDVCGHYTQVVWAKTMKVGCGIKHCSTVSGSFDNAWMFACDYSPPGNYNGEKPYVQGVQCSKCSSAFGTGGYKCEDDLCKHCLPQDDSGCDCEAKTCQNGGTFNGGLCRCECADKYFGPTCDKSCEDASPYCNQWTQYCADNLYKAFMTDNCIKTCSNLAPPECSN